jgi:hypothetical protein
MGCGDSKNQAVSEPKDIPSDIDKKKEEERIKNEKLEAEKKQKIADEKEAEKKRKAAAEAENQQKHKEALELQQKVEQEKNEALAASIANQMAADLADKKVEEAKQAEVEATEAQVLFVCMNLSFPLSILIFSVVIIG